MTRRMRSTSDLSCTERDEKTVYTGREPWRSTAASLVGRGGPLDVRSLIADHEGLRELDDLGGVAVVVAEHDAATLDGDAGLRERVATRVDGLLAIADQRQPVGTVAR